MGDGDDLLSGGCEGPGDLELAVQSGEVSVGRVRRAKGEEAWGVGCR